MTVIIHTCTRLKSGSKVQRPWVIFVQLLCYGMASIQWEKCFINPRRACAARVTVRPSVCLSVCYHVFCHYAQQGGRKAIPTGSAPHWLDFKNGDFRKNTKLWLENQANKPIANEHGLPRPDSARFRAR